MGIEMEVEQDLEIYLQLDHVSKEMDQNWILKDISIQCKRGKIYGFKGKNGSGKTMLMRIICGLVKPTKGHVTVGGITLGRKHNFPESVGALIETPGFIGNYSGYQNLKVLAEIQGKIGKKEIEDVMAEVGLNPKEKKKTKKYSLGMKQKLGIAAAIMENPNLIILDEPTRGIDVGAKYEIYLLMNELVEKGKSLIMISSEMPELIGMSDRIMVMHQGRLTGKLEAEEIAGNKEIQQTVLEMASN